MWHAAQPVARKLPRTALAGVHRWHDVHSFRSKSKNTSPDSLKVGMGWSPVTAPFGSGWPVGNGAPGVVAAGAIENFTCSFVGCCPFGKSVPLCVPERCAMIDDFTFAAIVWWHLPQV